MSVPALNHFEPVLETLGTSCTSTYTQCFACADLAWLWYKLLKPSQARTLETFALLCTHRTFETFVGNMEVQDPDEPTIPFLVYVWLTEYYIYIYSTPGPVCTPVTPVQIHIYIYHHTVQVTRAQVRYLRQWVEGKTPPAQVTMGETTTCASGVFVPIAEGETPPP